jgi:hypothetical protein
MPPCWHDIGLSKTINSVTLDDSTDVITWDAIGAWSSKTATAKECALFILGREPTGVGSVGIVSCGSAGDSIMSLFYRKAIVPWIDLGKRYLTQLLTMRSKYLTPLPRLVLVLVIPKTARNNNDDRFTCSMK